MLKVKDRHVHSLRKSASLSGMYYVNAIDPFEVIRVLNKARISFVLCGAHGLGGWHMKPRTTEDVDLVVAKKHLKKATRCLLDAFPALEAEVSPVVVRLRTKATNEVVIDLMKPVQTLYREVFKHAREVQAGRLKYRIPCLEMALVMKFGAMVSPYRGDDDKKYDAGDFIRMVNANPELDEDYLSELGELVYPGGGRRALQLVASVRAGERLVV